MLCPMCGSRTEVIEKRGPFRDRRCTHNACRLDFTTREQVMPLREDRRRCARTRATEIEETVSRPVVSAEAGSAAGAVLAVPPNARKDESGAAQTRRGLPWEAAA